MRQRLLALQKMRIEIAKAEDHLSEQRASQSASAARLNGMPKSYGDRRGVEATTIRIVTADKTVKMLKAKYRAAQVETVMLLDATGLHGKYLTAIKQHYILGESWLEIGRKLNCNPNTLRVRARSIVNKL